MRFGQIARDGAKVCFRRRRPLGVFSFFITLVVAGLAHGQAATPEDHPGYPLAQAIAEQGCVLHQDDVGAVMEELGLGDADFPQMAVPLMQTGFLRPSGQGTLTLENWGLCVGARD